MDRIELIKAAWDASDNAVFDSNNWNNYNDGFMKGAEWLMGQPLKDRLKWNEFDTAKDIYEFAKKRLDSDDLAIGETGKYEAKIEVIEAIFGKEMFNEK